MYLAIKRTSLIAFGLKGINYLLPASVSLWNRMAMHFHPSL
jgi:hypothetical protein